MANGRHVGILLTEGVQEEPHRVALDKDLRVADGVRLGFRVLDDVRDERRGRHAVVDRRLQHLRQRVTVVRLHGQRHPRPLSEQDEAGHGRHFDVRIEVHAEDVRQVPLALPLDELGREALVPPVHVHELHHQPNGERHRALRMGGVGLDAERQERQHAAGQSGRDLQRVLAVHLREPRHQERNVLPSLGRRHQFERPRQFVDRHEEQVDTGGVGGIGRIVHQLS
mmetsp:Transcript_119377/g.207810  ORF Transcript_119377/g.207810 Transcript_119377/m.207810 type:complete len:225 (+) Transcript_119377:2671-3345(+)